ncbi:hypothetical protein [Flavivirga aquatica]|uniref:hypothetical protein n=1 Tax=Flavivirga aquatica TaxID=1849968 RepID=UPI000F503095|nr:hypothetical protein [Flavivirga aquatica]
MNLINVFFSSNVISVNDSIYINNNYLAPFYGSNKNKTSFSKYSTLLEVEGNKFRIELSKDFKTTHISLGRCNIINDELSERIGEFNYITEYLYLIDGGETQLWKLYCTKYNLIVLGFNKYANIASINCNYEGEELPLFFRDVIITEKENYKKGFSSLSFNFRFENMLEKMNLICE